jgi:hypothetical protein
VDPKNKIVDELATRVCERVSRKIILKLQKLPSGYGNLKSMWDDICFQKQTEQFISWNLYDDAVKGLVSGFIENLEHYEQAAIWLQTDTGFDWHWDLMAAADREDASVVRDDKNVQIPLIIDEIVEYVANEYVYYQAGRWSNRRITDF